MGLEKKKDEEVKTITIIWFRAFDSNRTETFFNTPSAEARKIIRKEICETAVFQGCMEYDVFEQMEITDFEEAPVVSFDQYIKINIFDWDKQKIDFYKNIAVSEEAIKKNRLYLVNGNRTILAMVSERMFKIKKKEITENEKEFQRTALLLAWEQLENEQNENIK